MLCLHIDFICWSSTQCKILGNNFKSTLKTFSGWLWRKHLLYRNKIGLNPQKSILLCGFLLYSTVCQLHRALLYRVNLYTQLDMLHIYGCIDSKILCAAGVLTSFRYILLSHAMYNIKFEYTLHSKNKNLYWNFSLVWFFQEGCLTRKF